LLCGGFYSSRYYRETFALNLEGQQRIGLETGTAGRYERTGSRSRLRTIISHIAVCALAPAALSVTFAHVVVSELLFETAALMAHFGRVIDFHNRQRSYGAYDGGGVVTFGTFKSDYERDGSVGERST
jgi:hypothetical protein